MNELNEQVASLQEYFNQADTNLKIAQQNNRTIELKCEDLEKHKDSLQKQIDDNKIEIENAQKNKLINDNKFNELDQVVVLLEQKLNKFKNNLETSKQSNETSESKFKDFELRKNTLQKQIDDIEIEMNEANQVKDIIICLNKDNYCLIDNMYKNLSSIFFYYRKSSNSISNSKNSINIIWIHWKENSMNQNAN